LRVPDSAPLVGGGRQTTCITSLDAVPGPGVVMHNKGLMTFRLTRGSIKTRVGITQRFGPDGIHARQTVRGSVVTGTRAYQGARGTITGRGTVTDRASGLGPVSLRYALHLTTREREPPRGSSSGDIPEHWGRPGCVALAPLVAAEGGVRSDAR
jgi:hypothetical protein